MPCNLYMLQSFFTGLYWRIQMMDPLTYAIFFVAFTFLSTYLVAYAYRKLQFTLKYKLVMGNASLLK